MESYLNHFSLTFFKYVFANDFKKNYYSIENHILCQLISMFTITVILTFKSHLSQSLNKFNFFLKK